MALPFFYQPKINPQATILELDEDTSRHIVQVLRMQRGEQLQLTDGKGNIVTASISEAHKKHSKVTIDSMVNVPARPVKSTIAISLLKNANRFEWFLEKAVEIGITNIIPLVCKRTESEKFRNDRLQSICISAMLQSQQSWLPLLHEPIGYELLFKQEEIIGTSQKFIAHCEEDNKALLGKEIEAGASSIILIGPEGDFTPKEIEVALAHQFTPVSLGNTRLRTETAGIVAAALLCSKL